MSARSDLTRRDFLKISAGTAACMVLGMVNTGCGSGTSAAGDHFSVVVFSDVHFNPFYDPSLFPALVSADVAGWAAIFKTSRLTVPAAWGNDTNYPLLMLALSSIRQNLGASPFVIFPGDILVHAFHQIFFQLYGSQDVAAMVAFANKTVAFFQEQVRASVGTTPVMFAVGNNDSYADQGPDSLFLASTAELYYTYFLNGSVDQQTFLNTFKSGGYYSAEPPGTNLMVLGLNTTQFTPSSTSSSTTIAAELAWLDSRLASAKATGQKVWLIMHIPPGGNILATAQTVDGNGHLASAVMMWQPDVQAQFLQILAKYPGIITLKMAGHTHMDEYRLLSSDEVLEMTPSITPRSGNDPAYRVLTVAPDTLKPLDYTSLNYDLAAMPGQFNPYYTFSTAYSAQGFLDDSLVQLYPALFTDKAKQALYRTTYFSGHQYSIPAFDPITDTNWPVFRCGIGKMGQPELINCVNSR
jgi:sphingomyelin phosphodiesterase acid-like 3